MRLQNTWLPLMVCGTLLLVQSEARRIRVTPLPQEQEEESVQYYAAEPQEDEQQHQRVVLVSAADQYNGLYGQPSALSRSGQDNYIPRGRSKPAPIESRAKESSKPPPVQTIRNYNKVNDDGSFTFGYEAADGSFKEETRGTDCVVRGKYGYVDPDGNKREFTYVSGNPCDPNAPQEEPEVESNERDGGPANYPSRPIRPVLRPTAAPRPVSYFQNNYEQGEEEQPVPEQVLRQQPTHRPTYISRPQYVQAAQAAQEGAQLYQRSQLIPSTTPASVIYKQSFTPVSITPRPVSATASSRTQLPATTYRPQLLQVAVTPKPLYTKSSGATAAPGRGIDFDAEFSRFQQNNNEVSPTPSTAVQATTKTKAASTPSATPATTTNTGNVYSSALVYDPTTGQYNTQLYQTLPQTEGDFTLNHRIQPYVYQPQRQQQQSPLFTQNLRSVSTNPQTTYQQQQAGLQFQNSAQLYAQQQKVRAAQQPRPAQTQPLYYYQPSLDSSGGLSAGQIDTFLRGHNIQF